MKLDYDTAWKDTTGLIRANFSLLAVIAGVFFFIPYAALTVMLPEMGGLTEPSPDASPEEIMAMLTEFYTQYWWLLLGLALIQGTGILAMLALLKRRANPTVSEALQTGVKSVLPYFAAQLLQSLILVIVGALLIGVGVALSLPALSLLGALIAVVVMLYVVTKLSMVSPVIAIDGVLNPIEAMRRSWELTKGNSLRLFFFYLLIFVAFIVASSVLTMILTLGFALAGEQAALFGTAVVSSLINAGFILLMTAIFAAIHTQLTRLGQHAAEATDA